MSLEAAMAELTKAVSALTEAQTEHTEKLNAVLAAGGKAADGDDKPKRTRAKKEDAKAADAGDDEGETQDAALTSDGVKQIVAAWVTEFAKDQKDGETQARKDKIKATLTAMQKKDGFKIADAAKGATVADVPAAELHRIITWLEKQKAADNGFGVGRLTAVPSNESAADEGEEDI